MPYVVERHTRLFNLPPIHCDRLPLLIIRVLKLQQLDTSLGANIIIPAYLLPTAASNTAIVRTPKTTLKSTLPY